MNREQIIETMARGMCDVNETNPDDILTTIYRQKRVKRWKLYLPEATTALSALEAAGLVVVPVDALNWLNGCGDDFERRPDQKGAFWWRSEFQRRAGLSTGQNGMIKAAQDKPR